MMRARTKLLAIFPFIGLMAAACGGGSASAYPAGFQKTLVTAFEGKGLNEQNATCVANWLVSHLSYSRYQAEYGPANTAQGQKDADSADAACNVSLPSNSNSGNSGSSGSGNSGNSGSSGSGNSGNSSSSGSGNSGNSGG